MTELVAQSLLHTKTGDWKIYVYSEDQTLEHVALVKGDLTLESSPLVRVHSECLTGDTLGSKHCDCGEQKDLALQKIEQEGTGVFLYMRQEGRGIGLANKIKAYELQRVQGVDTVEANLLLGRQADERSYKSPADILKHLGVKEIRLLTNNKEKKYGLEKNGIRVREIISTEVIPNEVNEKYLKTKKQKMGHLLENV